MAIKRILVNGKMETKYKLKQRHVNFSAVTGLDFQKKSWGQLVSISFHCVLVPRTSILVAKNYLQEKIEYNNY